MTRTKIAVAAALLAAVLMPTMAQAQLSEPAAYQAAHPDRDVLNGGQLTPAARAALGQHGAPDDAYASQAYPSSAVPVVRSGHRHHRR
ncbi:MULTISPECIES: hypothetical protein [Bradyrhizobium]|uniref:Uncharacterized protein n=1 Tax=Bradyrhizobium nanningense TaxID=1325118 RepID=A0A4Q0S6J7_9BRAD|nr:MULTISPECIES: hypothetical protein [Bradyrhizobium]RXH29210.1 hypothetical protein XH99_13890 [Bradyrhizobium nanningense]RXH32489.1 hypothetical protein XH84_12825 [Bradyrhizobium nanningense]TQF34191.1 hypothetical protein UNPA324_09950 [Bradyrhizobium sp. UNPA324]